jgi:hypothetical protein
MSLQIDLATNYREVRQRLMQPPTRPLRLWKTPQLEELHIHGPPRRPTLRKLLHEVAKAHGLRVADLRGPSSKAISRHHTSVLYGMIFHARANHLPAPRKSLFSFASKGIPRCLQTCMPALPNPPPGTSSPACQAPKAR